MPSMQFSPKLQTTSLRRFQSHVDMSEAATRHRVPRILVVDDNPDVVVLMRELLETKEYEVVAVVDVAQAEAGSRPYSLGCRYARKVWL